MNRMFSAFLKRPILKDVIARALALSEAEGKPEAIPFLVRLLRRLSASWQ